MPTLSGNSWHYTVSECRLNMDDGVQNILKVLALASQDEYVRGKDWYPKARRDADKLASIYGLYRLDTIKVACAMSPKCPWQRNFDCAEWAIREYQSGCFVPDYQSYLSGEASISRTPKAKAGKEILAEDPRVKAPPFGGLKMGVIKALWLLQGHDCLKGPKVNRFCLSIEEWETYLGACVDSHAIQVWFYSFDAGTYGIPPSFYNIIEADYIRAAELVGLSPLQLQAITWLVKKRISKEMGKTRHA